MGDDKFEYEPYDPLPIPTYEEAVSHPNSSRSHIDLADVSSSDAERQGLLREGDPSGTARPTPRHHHGYQPPTVESARTSLDSLASSPANSERGSLENLRQEIDRMDVEDGPQPSEHSRLGGRFSKQFNSLTRTLSSIRFPLRKYLPNFRFRFTIDLDGTRTHIRNNGCMIMLRLTAVILVLTIVYIFFVSDIFSISNRASGGQSYSAASVENFIQGHINESKIAENLERLTKFPHVAGTEGSYVLAEWMQEEFKSAGLDHVQMEKFEVYLNYPRPDGRRVAIVDPPALAWEATLEEDDEQVPVFHGHSKAGNVTGPLVYANYGSRDDFKLLADRGISLNGSIVLVRYYGTETDRALKIKAAELAGAAGCIIYSDPAEDGFLQGPAYPKGRYMPADGVQRGGVSLMSWVVGDVLSPGFASTPEEKRRLKPEDSAGLNSIPSLPIAWRDAQKLLQALKGHGSTVPPEWVGGVPDVDGWWTGDTTSPRVNLANIQDEVERQPIYNVLGQITGLEQPEKKIIVGNHRDSWCLGGADPGSGTAVFLEVIRVFGELLTYGWRPLRTIEFASWDGEEYNLIGSTEHVENDLDALRSDAYAYLNVDVGVSGTEFEVAASPLFERIVVQILGRVSDPVANQTLKDIWQSKGKKLAGLGAGSDYVAFQDIAGTSSIDFGFGGSPYPYHSCHENFDWMVKFGDPGFQFHRMLGEFWGLLLVGLADTPILPFDLESYANYLSNYVADLETYAKTKNVPVVHEPSSADSVNIQPLFDAAAQFKDAAEQFSSFDKLWHDAVWNAGGFENNIMGVQRITHNNRIAEFETNLLDLREGGGVPNRTQFKHVIFGPQTWSGYDEAFFPAIRDSIDSGNWTQTQEWVDRVADILNDAVSKL
ncbi:hypothetical protein MPDQ_006371 [Monascus purpureus]|uniref:Glutamate carboxypeptidase Tre2 n=1 Tax=Monascus purpureus TaxID=5098 RepID=A0A507QUM3_MONPU|nr:hypothetical protein MPDQ_006371 [Monascus purpureus]BDD56906.1 hypothetical protein MAP00_002321 [Monascus purpureus]